MHLEQLIKFLVNPDRLEILYQEKALNHASEALLIYLKGALDLVSDVYIFEIEETEDDLIFETEGEKYFQLFPIDYAVQLIESDLELKDRGYSDLEIAKRLLDYRLKDV